MVKASVLDHAKAPATLDLATSVRAAIRSGKTTFSLIADLLRLGRGPGKLSVQEYFSYGLYDDRRFSPEAKRAFVGMKRQTRLINACCDLIWHGAAHDKILFYTILQGAGVPVLPTLAIYHPLRSFGTARALRDVDELKAFLRAAPCPFFGKPSTGMWSTGIASITAYDRDIDQLTTADGNKIDVAAFADAVEPYRRDGYLFQSLVHPHAAIQAVCGDRLATVRMIVLLTEAGPKLYRAVWKIPSGTNIADNFWRSGNMLGDVDIETGRIERVVRGTGPDREELANHPDSGAALVGFMLPDWADAKALCLSASRIFPGLRMQAWDVALTSEGPLLMELNVGGDFNLPQLARGAGLLDDEFRGFLAACGVKLPVEGSPMP